MDLGTFFAKSVLFGELDLNCTGDLLYEKFFVMVVSLMMVLG